MDFFRVWRSPNGTEIRYTIVESMDEDPGDSQIYELTVRGVGEREVDMVPLDWVEMVPNVCGGRLTDVTSCELPPHRPGIEHQAVTADGDVLRWSDED